MANLFALNNLCEIQYKMIKRTEKNHSATFKVASNIKVCYFFFCTELYKTQPQTFFVFFVFHSGDHDAIFVQPVNKFSEIFNPLKFSLHRNSQNHNNYLFSSNKPVAKKGKKYWGLNQKYSHRINQANGILL
ncbi:hypothetical protein BpHYR1_031456 [Brachionus plicatilis]|uniref:Uncharacterized protein n=1 Tax=Brachionus plicatilis TaxID=10195 RepID=A0A3M7SPA4_BRAPC|nr:hypothetical protein BpHYR1_031456 [Brachionus plicatilis]